MQVNKAKESLDKFKKKARAGETWRINDASTRGHKSTITKVENDVVSHVPRTHKSKTNRKRNIQLKTNPQMGDDKPCFILPKVKKSKVDNLGKQILNEDIKDPVDKALIRHLKHEDKKINKK